MAEFDTTIARPYARAVFESARAESDLAGWSQQLALLSAIARDPTMLALIGSPRMDTGRLAALIVDIAGAQLGAGAANLVRLLADNRRLRELPAIAQQYERLKAEAERTIEAEVVTAQAIADDQQHAIRQALERRLGRRVVLNCRADPALLGGAVVRAGDLVIDGSARARLQKLADALMH